MFYHPPKNQQRDPANLLPATLVGCRRGWWQISVLPFHYRGFTSGCIWLQVAAFLLTADFGVGMGLRGRTVMLKDYAVIHTSLLRAFPNLGTNTVLMNTAWSQLGIRKKLQKRIDRNCSNRNSNWIPLQNCWDSSFCLSDTVWNR